MGSPEAIRRCRALRAPLALAVAFLALAGVWLLAAHAQPSLAATPEVVRGRLLEFAVLRHARRYDVVSGSSHQFRLRHHARYVRLRELGRCAVVSRSARVVVLRSPVHAPLSLLDAHDIVYEGLDFEGSGTGPSDASAVIYIEGASHDITFRDCVIGTNQDGAGNGVKIVDKGRGMHDITFVNCTFKYQPRMGFECCGRSNPAEGGSGGPGYERVDVVGCTFAASAGQAISYDDDYSAVAPAGYCTVSGNRVAGAGVGDSDPYGSVIENNGVHFMTWKDNYFGAGRDSIVNISGRDAAPLDMVSTGNVYDAHHVPAGVKPHNQCLLIKNVAGGLRFADRIINDPAVYSGVWGYLSGCSGIDLGGTTVRNITEAPSKVYGGGNRDIVWPTRE